MYSKVVLTNIMAPLFLTKKPVVKVQTNLQVQSLASLPVEDEKHVVHVEELQLMFLVRQWRTTAIHRITCLYLLEYWVERWFRLVCLGKFFKSEFNY